MSNIRTVSLMRHVCLLFGATAFAVSMACAQSSTSPNPSDSNNIASANESSSLQFVAADGFGSGGAAHPAASAAAGGAAAGQDHGSRHGLFHSPAFEVGGGFNAPVGNDTPFVTWGGNFTGGAGVHFSPRISLLGEFQFIDDKLPGAFIAAGNGGNGGNGAGGNTHIFSLTVDPLIDLFPKWTNSAYVTGGFGFYHKSTNFTQILCCDFYGYPMTFTTNSFSSNQWGSNLGIGFTHRLLGTYGDGTMKLFAEARWVYIHTPPITQPNGLGTTALIPVTLGLRW